MLHMLYTNTYNYFYVKLLSVNYKIFIYQTQFPQFPQVLEYKYK